MKPAALLPLERAILERLAILHFATLPQLAVMCGADYTRVSRMATRLDEFGLIEVEHHARPKIYRISRPGSDVVGLPPPSGRRLPSWSVMAHACHRNAFALAMADQVPGFRLLSRLALLKQGFNPGHGEHAATDDAGAAWFILLDDFLMGSDRIARAWRRRHSPNQKYWPDPTGRTWAEVVQKFVVVTTDDAQAEKHRARILRDRLPAEVMTIKPLWRS